MAQATSDKESASGRNITINIRAQQRQRELIDQAAAMLGKNRSDFMLEIACREAEAVLLDRRMFAVDADTWTRFNALLDAPPRDLPELRKLLTAKAPWDK